MEIGIIVALLAILLAVWLISVQRRLVVLDENIKNAMSQIGVQLSSWYDATLAPVSYTPLPVFIGIPRGEEYSGTLHLLFTTLHPSVLADLQSTYQSFASVPVSEGEEW